MSFRISSRFAWAVLALLTCVDPAYAQKTTAYYRADNSTTLPKIDWQGDYGEAMKCAELGRKLLLIYFREQESSPNQRKLDSITLNDPKTLATIASDYVAVKVPLGYEVSVGGKMSPLLGFEAFADLNGRPGVALIDYAHQNEEYSGYVVSVLPLDNGKYYRFQPHYLSVMLELPSGTLTQRTMIFAVRVHPEGPASTHGGPNQPLQRSSRTLVLQAPHSLARASQLGLAVPENRSHARRRPATARSRRGKLAGENLVDAAIDCVDCWRQSPGHWGPCAPINRNSATTSNAVKTASGTPPACSATTFNNFAIILGDRHERRRALSQSLPLRVVPTHEVTADLADVCFHRLDIRA